MAMATDDREPKDAEHLMEEGTKKIPDSIIKVLAIW